MEIGDRLGTNERELEVSLCQDKEEDDDRKIWEVTDVTGKTWKPLRLRRWIYMTKSWICPGKVTDKEKENDFDFKRFLV